MQEISGISWSTWKQWKRYMSLISCNHAADDNEGNDAGVFEKARGSTA